MISVLWYSLLSQINEARDPVWEKLSDSFLRMHLIQRRIFDDRAVRRALFFIAPDSRASFEFRSLIITIYIVVRSDNLRKAE